ncbi:hypothetical protein ACFSCX_21325 [Bacillus salitolerans]|uniref:Uncharacterized protein n=1 Tax=Bacillus salitolerans TaxID=1437434 RepID=A0ABW4LV58_9BACI
MLQYLNAAIGCAEVISKLISTLSSSEKANINGIMRTSASVGDLEMVLYENVEQNPPRIEREYYLHNKGEEEIVNTITYNKSLQPDVFTNFTETISIEPNKWFPINEDELESWKDGDISTSKNLPLSQLEVQGPITRSISFSIFSISTALAINILPSLEAGFEGNKLFFKVKPNMDLSRTKIFGQLKDQNRSATIKGEIGPSDKKSNSLGENEWSLELPFDLGQTVDEFSITLEMEASMYYEITKNSRERLLDEPAILRNKVLDK